MKVSDYIEILNVKNERFDNELDRSISMLSIYLDEDIEDVELMEVKEVNRQILAMNDFLNSPPSDGHSAIHNTKITLGNFIDLETYLQSPNDLTKCLAILFRKSKLNEWGHVVYEPVNFNINERAETFNDEPIELYLKGLSSYIKFRESIVEQYKSIFGIGESEPEEIDYADLTASEIMEIEAEEKKRKEKERYSWENFVYWLAGENLVNVEKVLEFPILYTLNMASMKKLYEN